MSAGNETIADIAAEMRALVAQGETLNNTYELLHVLADRIEAAAKRERGDAAAMRKTVKTVAQAAAEIMERVRHKDGLAFNTANYIIGIANAALAKPPRNCDRFGGETEAMVAFLKEKWLVGVMDLEEYPFCEWSHVMKAMYAKWLLATSTEQKGETDGGK